MIYLFEDRSLDTDRRELRRGNDPIDLQPQVFDLVLYLIRHRERVVTRDELIAVVWKGRIVSESTISSRIAAARDAVGDDGEQQRIIRTLRRVGLRFVSQVQEGAMSGGTDSAPEITEALDGSRAHAASPIQGGCSILGQSSIAVHAFSDLSEDPKQERFVRGIVEDITTSLSQFPWLFVIERSPEESSSEWSVDIERSEHAPKLRYLLKGSLRFVGRRVRVTARLVDPATGTHIWASRFDADHDDALDLQSQISDSVVKAIGPRLEQLEIKRAGQVPTARLDSLGCYLLGMGRLYQWNRSGINEALTFFKRAIERDPEFATAYGMAAYCYVQRKSYGWISDREQEAAECARLAQQAAALARDDAVALTKAAHAISSVARDIDSGADFVELALKINPGLAAGWYVSGWIRLFLGEPDVALDHLARALGLGQFDPLRFKIQSAIGYAHFLSGQYDEAAAWAERALSARPYYLTGMRLAAAGHTFAGRRNQAQKLISRMHAYDPELTLSTLPDLIPFQRQADAERWSDALAEAGLPQ